MHPPFEAERATTQASMTPLSDDTSMVRDGRLVALLTTRLRRGSVTGYRLFHFFMLKRLRARLFCGRDEGHVRGAIADLDDRDAEAIPSRTIF
jgi:hypothetical protein